MFLGKMEDWYENGYISKLSHSGELQWRKLIADVNQITTETDGDNNLYTSWSRNSYHTEETRGAFIAKLNPDNGEIVWKTKNLKATITSLMISTPLEIRCTQSDNTKAQKGLYLLPSIGMMARCSGRKR